MKVRRSSLGSCLALLLAVAFVAIPATAGAFDRFVNPLGTCPPEIVAGKPSHLTIQEAVTAASVGDLIGVCAGTYAESVVVGTDKLTIRPPGASVAHVVAPPPGPPNPPIGFDVTADGVTILGFEVSGFDGDEDSCGIRVTGANVTVSENDVHDNVTGICLMSAKSALVFNNTIRESHTFAGTHGDGLVILFGQDNTALRNRVLNNASEGIDDLATLRDLLQQNVLSGNHNSGIFVNSSWDTRLSRNTTQHNAVGISIHFAHGAVVDHNVATANLFGFGVTNSTDCLLSLNRASENSAHGIFMRFSSTCVLDGNRAIDNDGIGIELTNVDPGNTILRNSATGNRGLVDCFWDGSDAPHFENNACRTEVPPGAWD